MCAELTVATLGGGRRDTVPLPKAGYEWPTGDSCRLLRHHFSVTLATLRVALVEPVIQMEGLRLADRQRLANELSAGNDGPLVAFVRRSFEMLLVPAKDPE